MIRSVSLLKIIFTLCLALSWVATGAWAEDAKSNADPDSLILTFLGTGAPRPSFERYGPSILVEAGERKLIVDAGSGMRERLFEAGGFPLLTSVDTFLITHLHFDHTISVPGLWLSGWLYGRRVPMTVYGPAGTSEMMSHLRKAYEWDIDYRGIVGVPLQGSKLISTDVNADEVIRLGDMKITAIAVEHMPIDVNTGEKLGLRGATLGYRIDYKGRSVVFSGDTRSTAESALIRYGKDVDVLIHEVQVPSPGNSKEAKLANVSLSVHSTPKQTAFIFSKTKPGLAVYSHIIPPGTSKQDLVDATRPFYDGPLEVANDLMRITVGEEIKIETLAPAEQVSFEKSSVLAK